MATNTSSKRPATTLRCDNIKATTWQNVSEKGSFFATTFSRRFKDQSGVWRNGTSCRTWPHRQQPVNRFRYILNLFRFTTLPFI
jgi:hypothetical protein